jgi:hypothetical protein
MLGDPLQLRLGERDVARLDALARRLPGVKRAALARELLLARLEECEADVSKLLRDVPPPLALGPAAGPIA